MKNNILKTVLYIYRLLFSNKFFFKFNKLIYTLSLRGMGILNFESDKISGEDHFIKEYLSKVDDCIIFDVGANVGNYSKILRSYNLKARIYAFEPHPVTFQRLKENTGSLNIQTNNVAVGALAGSLKLYDYANEDGSSHASLYKAVIEEIHKAKSTEYNIDVITLDDFCHQAGIDKIDLLKIDTEGHELEVLKGCERLLKVGKVDLIHFEFNEMNVASRVFFKDFWDFLPNYDFYRMLPNGLVHIDNYNPVSCEIFAYQNIVARLKKNNNN
ncbi:MAG: FkbM family methyltransferase [Methylophilus sp.]|uniref:FkbM family methyltransferase n=1 Tax=Methylophilus sp. TaxID=29541 RepID=UPI0040352286